MQETKLWAPTLLVITDLKHKNDNQKGKKKLVKCIYQVLASKSANIVIVHHGGICGNTQATKQVIPHSIHTEVGVSSCVFQWLSIWSPTILIRQAEKGRVDKGSYRDRRWLTCALTKPIPSYLKYPSSNLPLPVSSHLTAHWDNCTHILWRWFENTINHVNSHRTKPNPSLLSSGISSWGRWARDY